MRSRFLRSLLPSFFITVIFFLGSASGWAENSLSSGTPEEIVAHIDNMVQTHAADKTSVTQLTQALADPNGNIKVRERAAWALGQLQARTAGPALIQAAKHKGLLIRSAALGSLIRFRARSALPVYIDIATNDPVLSMRQRATVALGLLRWEKAIQPLVKLSSDATPEVRGAAALGMAATHSKKNDFSQALKEMESDENPYVKERAERALEVVEKKNEAIRNQLKSEDPDIRLFAAVYFHFHGTSADLPTLKDSWNGDADDEVRHELSQAITAIKKRSVKAAHKKKKIQSAPLPQAG